MLTLILSGLVGAYTSQRLSIVRDGEIASISIDHRQIWKDAIAFFTFIGFVCNWAVSMGRNARNYCDLALLPWLNDRGISVHLPAIDLPKLPAAQVD